MSEEYDAIGDPEFGTFFREAGKKRLCLPRCTVCLSWRWPVRPVCPRCRAFPMEWETVRPAGDLFTWTVVHHQTMAECPPPYVIGLVSLSDCPVRMAGNVLVEPEDLVIGMPLVGRFDTDFRSRPQLNWVDGRG